MTMAEDRAGRSADNRFAERRPYGYAVPGNLTAIAQHAFHTEVRVFAAELANQTERVAHAAHRMDPLLTADDVHAARQRVGHSLDDSGDQRVLGAGLLTVGPVGVGVMGNFLHSPLQVVVFGAFVVFGLAGLLLTWAGRPVSG